LPAPLKDSPGITEHSGAEYRVKSGPLAFVEGVTGGTPGSETGGVAGFSVSEPEPPSPEAQPTSVTNKKRMKHVTTEEVSLSLHHPFFVENADTR
jgi:hypothetical protein